MSEAWIPVLFAAVIVVGAVGGSLAQMVLKELLPLLRSIAQQRQSSTTVDVQKLVAEVRSLEQRLSSMEQGQQRLAEDSEFMRRLLETRATIEER